MFDDIPIIAATTSRMNWLANRQQILAQNIANVDTPYYKAQDLDPEAFKRFIYGGAPKRVNLAVTHPSHSTSLRGTTTHFPMEQKSFYEATLSENTVNLEENLIKMNQNANEYSLASNVYGKMHGLINIAIGKGR